MKIEDILVESKTSSPIIYLDLDGVLSDLYNYAAEIHDVEHYAHMTTEEWQRFFKESDAYHLFRSIPPFANINEIISIIKTYTDNYVILTSPLNFDREGSIKGKKEWIAKNIPGNPKVIYDHEKFKYATQADGTPNILIDDYKGNTIPWQENGGIAIKFQNDEDPVSKIKDGLENVFGRGLNRTMDIKEIYQRIKELDSDTETLPEVYDSVDIELSKDFVIETGVIAMSDDKIILHIDETAYNMLELQGLITESLKEAEYQGRKVTLNKPMPGDVKKSKVYVKKPDGKVVKVNFGDKNMKIKKSNPERRKSFRARHKCDNPGPKWKARYWSCKAW